MKDVARLRLRNQRIALDFAKFESPEDVVGWLGAVQSQDSRLDDGSTISADFDFTK